MIFFCPSRGRARKIGFYALFSKIICFRLRIGVSYQLLKERGSKLAQIFACGIKIDAILITSSLVPSRLSHLARVIFKKFIPSTYSQWEVTKLRVFFKNFFSHLFPVGEAIYQGVFEKTFKNSVAARESGYCPFTYSMFESHFVNPSQRFLHLTHVWRPFCQPIIENFSYNPLQQLSEPKNDIIFEKISTSLLLH